jgi:hypothetical protein
VRSYSKLQISVLLVLRKNALCTVYILVKYKYYVVTCTRVVLSTLSRANYSSLLEREIESERVYCLAITVSTNSTGTPSAMFYSTS